VTHGYLIAKLSTMSATFPGLGIDPATGVRSISLERHEADIAVRIGRPDDGDVIAKPVATIAYGFYATAKVCARLAEGEEPAFAPSTRRTPACLKRSGCPAAFLVRGALSARATSLLKASQRAQGSASRFFLTTSAGPSPVCGGGVTLDPFPRRRQNARRMPINVVVDQPRPRAQARPRAPQGQARLDPEAMRPRRWTGIFDHRRGHEVERQGRHHGC
jgi:hypothetical protein